MAYINGNRIGIYVASAEGENSYQAGYRAGHQDGYVEGMDKGHDIGYESGYRAGFEAGKAAANNITFTMEYQAIGEQGLVLTAVRGMTWGQWVDSEYNRATNGEPLLYNDMGEYLLGCEGDEGVYDDNDVMQTLSDVIVENEYYHVR